LNETQSRATLRADDLMNPIDLVSWLRSGRLRKSRAYPSSQWLYTRRVSSKSIHMQLYRVEIQTHKQPDRPTW